MYWKLALAQHPMYLLIKEDTGCAERTPPWGAPDIESYIARLRQNVTTLRQHPQLRIGYEWSGLELELLKNEAPDVFDDMLAMVKAGQTTFYNGTYSQPHLQTLSSEANFRQFEWGAWVYRELCNKHQVLTYAHQESSVNEQTPQLLKAFGIRFGVLPLFSSTLTMIDGGELIFRSRFGTMFIQGEEFAGWKGLDGTVEPLYLAERTRMPIRDWINFQEVLGLTHVPPILVEMPDLIDVNQEWIDDRSNADFALLDDALEERYKDFPPRFNIRFYSNWSYIEGIRAEELSRSNWKAEVCALRAEALNSVAFAFLKRQPESTDAAWKKILTTQHHDVYCFCAPELRDKSIGWLKEAEADASRLAASAARAVAVRVDTSLCAGQPLVVFNSTPHSQQSLVSTEVDLLDPVVADLAGKALPCESALLPSGKTRLRFIADLSGLGYDTFSVQTGGEKSVAETLHGQFVFGNRFYRATIDPDGSFTSLIIQPSGAELLEGAAKPANRLLGRDSTNVGPKHEGSLEANRPANWEPSANGPELEWHPNGSARVRRSPLGAVFTVSGEMSARVNATLVLNFYDSLPRIDLDWALTFSEASIGHFFDDDTKLRVQWPLAFSGAIHHDIAFGVVETRDERPFFPASWLDISDGNKGLAYFHQGTLKHWVIGQTLVNLFAWGENTDAIGNRLGLGRWPKCFDQRLQGFHTIHAAVLPHTGDWRAANVISAARSYGIPPLAIAARAHSGDLPAEMSLMQVVDPELVSTAVKVEAGEILCRLYSVKQGPAPLDLKLNGVKRSGLSAIGGEKIDRIGSFQIATLLLE